MKRGRVPVGIVIGVLASALAGVDCGGGDNSAAVSARVSCYPPCLASLVRRCPLLSACKVALALDPSINNPELRQGVAVCYASGEKQWKATNETSDNSYEVIKASDGSECYTAVSAGLTLNYTLSVGGQTVAMLDVTNPATNEVSVTCDGATTTYTATSTCFFAPWLNAISCDQVDEPDCDFGVPPPGALPATGG